MTYVLVALAALSLVGGLAGLPHLWHLPNYLHQWLDPVFEGTAGLIRDAGHGRFRRMGADGALDRAGPDRLAAGSVAVPRQQEPDSAEALARPGRRGSARSTTLVYNKYYVDEIYDATVVKAVMQLRLALDWFDRTVVDGLVNLTRPVTLGLAWLHGKTDAPRGGRRRERNRFDDHRRRRRAAPSADREHPDLSVRGHGRRNPPDPGQLCSSN